MVMLRVLSRAPVFLAFPPPLLLFALNLPSRLAAAALSGVLHSDLLLHCLDHICLAEFSWLVTPNSIIV
jgi:hypothetical protein